MPDAIPLSLSEREGERERERWLMSTRPPPIRAPPPMVWDPFRHLRRQLRGDSCSQVPYFTTGKRPWHPVFLLALRVYTTQAMSTRPHHLLLPSRHVVTGVLSKHVCVVLVGVGVTVSA